MSQEEKRHKISLQTKLKVIEAAQRQASLSSIMKEFDIRNKSTVAMILKNKEKYIAAAQKTSMDHHRILSFSKYPDVDGDLQRFISDCALNNRPVNIEVLRKEAKKCAQNQGYANFPASNGYLEKFLKKKRSLDSTVVSNAMQEWADKWLPRMVEGYSRNDVFNGDEFSLSYRNIPKKMGRHLKKQGCYNTQKVTVFVAANWSSNDKLQLVVIGKSRDPVCLKNKEVPIIYRGTRTGRMTRQVFEDIMAIFNEHFRQRGRRVLFLVDMCDEHKVLTLSNLKVDFWPPAAAARLQPLQQGIIPLLKENYQRLFTEKVALLTEEGKVPAVRKLTLWDTCFMLHSLWEQVERDQITSAFLQAGFPGCDVSLAFDVECQATCESSATAEDALRLLDPCRHPFNGPCTWEVANSSVEEVADHSLAVITRTDSANKGASSSGLCKDPAPAGNLVSLGNECCPPTTDCTDVTLGSGCSTEVGSSTLVEDVFSPLHSVIVLEEKAGKCSSKAEAVASICRSLSTGQFVDTLEASLLTANIIESVDSISQCQSEAYPQTIPIECEEEVQDFSGSPKELHAVWGYVSSQCFPELALDMVSGI